MNTRRLVVLLAALAAVLLTARLGLWQLDRAEQKTLLQTALDTRRAQPALAADELARDETEAARQHHRATTLQGRWLDEHTLYLDNRQMRGRPGFYVLTPLLLADGTAVLVQRGWLPRNMLDRSLVRAPALPSAATSFVQGRIAPGPGRLYEFEAAASGVIRQNLALADYAQETGLRLRPFSLVQEDTRPPLADGLLREWPQPATGVAKHHGYAFQWFALSTLILGLYVWFQLIRPRR